MTNLALFDLDHTLLPIDSDKEWGRFLVRIGAVDGPAYTKANEAFYQDYSTGNLDMPAYLRFCLAPLAQYTRDQLDTWHAQYMKAIIEPAIRAEAIALLNKHRIAGDLCCIVSATNTFVTTPIAHALGIKHLIGTRPATMGDYPNARYTGNYIGTPSFREGKISCTETWLKTLGKTWGDFEHSFFYSDSANDVPLMEKVTHPVATNPDEPLRAIALARRWPILELFT
ncbi:HAD family hydrolase [Candidatus Pandoraea novymonadis]|uniref:Hydrolase n=1 Tax=Candidatus Pandoraea novymonadis TaxID=1808959 RepID=A0ABX5FDR8_9BURK|nr:HAD family hydrolase [Candidatus Pandoraea novymonadis]PSB91883.1 putative hydrolase [Candidatus Pandoraea novymonadis]